MQNVAQLYLEEAVRSLHGIKQQADAAIEQLSDEQFFAGLDAESNSVAIIVKHMAGSTGSRWTDFLTTDGEKPDRNRDQEFIVSASASRAEILKSWEERWQLVLDTVGSLKPEDLTRQITIRNEPHSVLKAINRSIAHLALHTGQIIFLAKHWKGSGWKTLSIPRGQSAAVDAAYAAKLQTK